DPRVSAATHGNVAMAALTSVKINVFNAHPGEDGLLEVGKLGCICCLECAVKWSGKGNRIAADRRYLHHLIERAILPNVPTPRTAARTIMRQAPEDVRTVVRDLSDENNFADA